MFPISPFILTLLVASFLFLLVMVMWVRLQRATSRTKQEDSFSTLFEQQPEAWVILDGISLRAIKANQKAMNLFGIYRDQYLGKLSFDKMFQEDLADDEVALLLNAVDNATFQNKILECRSVQGRKFKVNVTISRVYEGNLFCRFSEPLEQALPIAVNSREPEVTEVPQEAPTVKSTTDFNEDSVLGTDDHHVPVMTQELSNVSGQMIHTAVDAIAVIGIDQNFIEVNEAFASFTGYTVEELRAIGFDQLIHPSEAMLHQQWFAELTDGKYRVSRAERSVLKKDGKTARLEFLGASLPVKQAIIVTAIDVSTVRETQQVLMRNRENLLALVENTGETVFSLDAMGRITVLNSQYKNFFRNGHDVPLIEGMLYEEALLPEERKAWKERFRNVLQGNTVNYREEVKDSIGLTHVYEALLYPVKDEEGLITGVTYSGRDISERIRQEEALREAKENAEQATRAKSEFLAVMSHEIRTPLNGLIGISELLNSTTLNNQQKEFVDIIRLSGEALLQVISDILDFSKIEANKMQLEYAPFKVEEAISETLTILSGRAREKGLELKMDREEGVPLMVVGDKARLRQVLMNLVGNALKFTDRGGVTVSVRKFKEEQHGEVVLEFGVKDTGVGISAEQAEGLFTAFTQADPSTYRKYGGTGLGLTICKTLVGLMGGKIWVESRIGEGSTFYFTLLARTVSQQVEEESRNVKPVEKAKVSMSEAAGDFAKNFPSRILLAEDNDINRLLAGKLFERLGYKITTVPNGKEAYNILIEESFDIVFMDVQMPEWDGLEATKHIREEKAISRQPVIIAMTAFAGQDDKQACFDAGMDDYISKPIILDDIERTMMKWSNNDEQENSMKKIIAGIETATGKDLLDPNAIQRLMDIGKQTDPGFLQQVLEMFMKQAPENIEEIRQSLERGDFAAMWKTAHKLKGTSLNIGAARLSELCREIEKKGRNLETSGLHGLTMQLENDYKTTIQELKNLFQYN